MVDQIQQIGMNHTYTSLAPVLGESSPEDYFSEIPYEKGYHLLLAMENLIGEDNMQEMLWQYIFENEEKSVTTDTVREKWEKYVEENY